MKNSPFRRVAVAIDDSPASKAAFAIARLIVAAGGELAFVHAINRSMIVAECGTPYGGDAGPAIEAFAKDEADLFASAVARAAGDGIRSTIHGLDGSAGSCIADFVRDGRFDAIVIGTHARHGLARLVLGSTADTVLRSSSVPTFVTSEQDVSRIGTGIRRMLVAVDGSQPAVVAVRSAIALAQACSAEIVFTHVTDADAPREKQAQHAIADARDSALAARVPSEFVVVTGSAAQAIVNAAASVRADLIVIGTHGRTGIEHMRLGSVAEAVIRAAPLPVMAVPSGAPVGAAVLPSAVTAIGCISE